MYDELYTKPILAAQALVHGHPLAGDIAVLLGQYLPYALVVTFFAFELFFRRPRRDLLELFWILAPAFVALCTSELLKLLLPFPRPYILLNNEVTNLIDTFNGMGAFPSSHTAFFAALAVAFYFRHHRIGLLYFLGALLIGGARVFAGVHWPMDILGGLLLGGIVAAATFRIELGIEQKKWLNRNL